jgi:hypothetical protein
MIPTQNQPAVAADHEAQRLVQALHEQRQALTQLAELQSRLDGLGDRRPDADSTAADPGDLRDEASRLQAGLAALAPRLAVASALVRRATRAARGSRRPAGPADLQ